MAFDHLRGSLTRGNLWVYILRELQDGDATPGEIITMVKENHGFSPAKITFYSVIYRLRREGLVSRSSESFRSKYSITPKGKTELAKAVAYIREVSDRVG